MKEKIVIEKKKGKSLIFHHTNQGKSLIFHPLPFTPNPTDYVMEFSEPAILCVCVFFLYFLISGIKNAYQSKQQLVIVFIES